MKCSNCFILVVIIQTALMLSPAQANVCMVSSNEDLRIEVDRCTKILRSNPKKVSALCDRAQASAFLHQYQTALDDYGQAIMVQPKSAKIYRDRARVYASFGDYQKSILEDARLSDKNSVLSGSKVEAESDFARSYQLALSDFNVWLERHPKDSFVLTERAKVYSANGEFENAINDCNVAIKLAPKNAFYFLSRAEVNEDGKRFQAALQDCSEAIAKDPIGKRKFLSGAAAQMGYEQRARVNAEMEQFEKALADYGHALLLVNQSSFETARILSARAKIYVKTGRNNKAVEDYKRAIKAAPRDFWAYLELGDLDIAAKDYSDAIAVYSDFISILNPQKSPTFLKIAYGRRSEAYMKMNEPLKALKDSNAYDCLKLGLPLP